MTELVDTKPTVMDLEEPILRARNAAKTLEMVLETVLSIDCQSTARLGSVKLTMERDEFEAAHYAMAEVRSSLRQVSDKWEEVFNAYCRNC